MKFRAAVLRQAGLPRPYARSRPLAIETVELPSPAAGEVLVEIKSASICHSRAHLPHAVRHLRAPRGGQALRSRGAAGSCIGSCLPSRDIPAFVSLYRQGRLPVDRLVTRTLAFESINEAMDELADARAPRQVIGF